MSLLVISLGATLLLAAFLIVPWVSEIGKINQDLISEREKNKRLAEKESLLRSADPEELSKTLSSLTSALPNEKEIPALVAGVARLSGESGLKVEGMQISPGDVSTASAKAKEDLVEFQLTVSGSVEGLKGFLSNLEKAKRLMSVEDLTASVLGDSATLTIALNLSAPFENFAPPPSELSAAVPRITSEQEKVLSELNKFTDYTSPVSPGATGKENPFIQ